MNAKEELEGSLPCEAADKFLVVHVALVSACKEASENAAM